MPLQIAILGSVEARMKGDVIGVASGRQRALLALLAVRAPQPVSAEVAAEALWPRAAPAEALRSLQVTVSRLRRSLGAEGAAVETVASGYRLVVEGDATDARRFEALIGEARAARVRSDEAAARRLLDDALGLWRGPALADVRFESFAQAEIARLEELRVAALEERMDARLADGEHVLAVAELEQLSAEHPSRERLVGLLMLALYRCGRQSDALDVYTRGRQRLDEQLGLEPSPELQRLQESILRHDPQLDAHRGGNRDATPAPEGVVTMLFTDIEGSTRLARAAGSAWPRLLAEHHALVSDAVERAGGHLDGSEGDALSAYFADPAAAVAAASAAQRALRGHAWPEQVGELRVRMGIHAGLVSRAGTGCSGLEVHMAARVMAAGHGAHVVVSAAARALLAPQVELVDAGEHRLKDFPAPERLWLLVYDDTGPGDFGPLRTEPVRPTNLLADPRRLVGREAELESLWDMLTGRERLVTIVGLGGTGKTRLAIAAAEGLLSAFEGGVWLVALAGVRERGALISTIAAALEVGDASGAPEDAVTRRLRARPTLLVLDNFEQLVDAASTVAALLERAPGTRVLVTSQLPLRVAPERLLRLAPLGPASAVALFDERARAAAPDFDPGEHREAIEAICARVDGMPLALELAAARVSTIAPGELLARLDGSLGVLTRGPRDLAERHRSLRAALEWTHDLLERDERTLFARLAAFAGPAPLDAVEAIAAVKGEHGPIDALDALGGLIDASLVARDDGREHGVRYTMPQAVRDFAAEQLTESGEEKAVRAGHAAHVASVGETFRGPRDQVGARIFAVEAEQRAALDWTRAHAPELHTRVASALGLILVDTGRAREAYTELGLAIERSGIAGAADGWGGVVRAVAAQAIGSQDEGAPLIEPGLDALRATGNEARLELGLRVAGVFWLFADEPERSLEATSEALAIARRRSHIGDLVGELIFQAQTLVALGRLDEAERLVDEATPLVPLTGDSNTFGLNGIYADIAVERGNWALAARLNADGCLSVGHNPSWLVMGLWYTAIALAQLGADDEALELEASADSLAAAIGEAVANPLADKHGWALREARDRVGPERAAAAARRGRELPESESAARAVELVRAAGVSAAT